MSTTYYLEPYSPYLATRCVLNTGIVPEAYLVSACNIPGIIRADQTFIAEFGPYNFNLHGWVSAAAENRNRLYFEIQAQLGEEPTARLNVRSAPPQSPRRDFNNGKDL